MISRFKSILKFFFRRDIAHLKKGWLYLFISNPEIYFLKLIKHTIWIGVIAGIMSFIYYFFELQEHKIPTIFHNLIGVVIGLVLVFRTNTAYDRWWEGVKAFNAVYNNITFFVTKLKTSLKEGQSLEEQKQIYDELKLMVNNLRLYLVTDDDKNSDEIYNKIISSSFLIMKKLAQFSDKEILTDKDQIVLETIFRDMMKYFDDCKRIKNTPIPIAYTLHIKISIISYILTLPFGLLHDMGFYSVFIVMMVYYIIAGIEIISNEIENPFRGDPNDIPMDEFVSDIENTIDFTSSIK